MSADPVETAIQTINSKLICSKCSKNFKEPKLLPCFHVFCKSCLEKLVVQGLEKQSLTCHACQYQVTLPEDGVAGLQADFKVEHLLEDREALEKAKNPNCENCKKNVATNYCQQCKVPMCQGCTEMHPKWGDFSNHEFISTNEVKAGPANVLVLPKKAIRCVEHNKKLTTYCNKCSKLVCSICVLESHTDHNCKRVEEVFPQHKTELVASLETLKGKLDSVKRTLSTFDARDNEINNQRAGLEDNIKKEIGMLRQLLDKREQELVTSLKTQTEQKQKDLADHRGLVQTTQAKISGCFEYAEAGLETGTEGEVLRMKAPVLERIEEINAEFDLGALQPNIEADLELSTDNQASKVCEEFGEVGPNLVCAENSVATGFGTKLALSNVETKVEVHPKSKKNVEIKCELQIVAKLVHTRSRLKIKCTYEQENGQHIITYKAFSRGRHNLHITVNGKHIRGSPYAVVVTPLLAKPVRVERGWNEPYGVAVNSRREIIVAGHNEDCISILGEQRTYFGNDSFRKGYLRCPYGVTVDSDDNIYVVDDEKSRVLPLANDRVLKFDSSGTFVATASSLQLKNPIGICFNKTNKHLYVCDQLNHRVLVLTTDLAFVKAFGDKGNRDGQFECPLNSAFDSDNNLYVTDSGNNRVQVFTAEGKFVRAFSDKANEKTLVGLNAIAIDSDNVVYVSENGRHCVSRFTTDGEYIDSFGGHGREDGQFNGITGLCIDHNECVLVCDCHNNRLQIF